MRPYSTCLAIIKYRAILTFTGWRCMRPHSTCLAIIKYRAGQHNIIVIITLNVFGD
jgi:hypothetical protein